jgi:integrase/recombinase XerD
MKRENLTEKHKNNVKGILDRFVRFSKITNWNRVSQKEIFAYLDTLRKPEEVDPLHRWIGSYNFYITVLTKFFKSINNTSMVGIKRLKRREKSVYKPSDLWTVEDDKLFLKYCPSKRDKCYHMIARDSSCRPHEILKLRIKDIVFKVVGTKQYAEILVNGKTGSRHIPLIDSIPYLKDWLDDHPQRTNPNMNLICSARRLRAISTNTLWVIYKEYQSIYFPKLLEDPRVSPEDKNSIAELVKKPWNPYIRRHSALTDKSKILKEHILRQHAGWSVTSNIPEKYLHYFGNESNESILEAYGLKPKQVEINKLQPVQCPNCSEMNKIDSKFCSKCRMILSYEAYEETVNEQIKKVVDLDYVASLNERLKVLESKLG